MSTPRKELEASWARTRMGLQNAFAQLPASPIESIEAGSIEGFREYLNHNELELALDELEGLGEQNPVGRTFWSFLLQAAVEMKLGDHVARYRERLSGE